MRTFLLALLPASLLLHCGGNTVVSSASTTSGSGGTATSSGTGPSSSTGTGGSASGCPAEPPTVGAPCDVPGSTGSPPCTYGSEPIPECREAFACADGGWANVKTPFGPCPTATGCPSVAPASGSDCSNTTSPECAFTDGTICSCGTFAGPQWTCFTPSGDCPMLVPNAGTACTAAGASCSYEGCNLSVTCDAGVWHWGHVDC